MRTSIRRLSRFALLVGLGVVELVGCSSDSRRGGTEEVATGTLRLPLEATAQSGNVYRLRFAFFQITRVSDGQAVAFLSSEDDLARPILTAVLDTGEYTVTLTPGWFMERVLSGGGSGGSSGGFGGKLATGGVFPGDFGGAPSEGGESFGGAPDEPQSSGGTFTKGGSTGFAGALGSGGRTGGGEQTVFVDAQLLSPAVQFFSVFSRSDSFVSFTFQIGGDVINFNQGRVNIGIDVIEAEPQCDTPPEVTRSERVLLENDAAAVANIRLIDVFNALASNGGFAGDGLRVYQEIFDSYASADQAQLPDAVHCGDETTDGVPTLNGYPIQCNRRESAHVADIDNFFATSFVNRLDLAPANGANCGQQRMVFANPSRGRTFMIIEAQVPNPRPELGIDGCLPLARFWFDQNSISDPFVRGDRLAQAFLGGHPELVAQGFGPFYTATNLTIGSGQIRTNQFDDNPWTLREFKLALDGETLKAIPFPVAESPNGALWNEFSGLPQGEACRTDFLTAMQGLMTDDPSQMSFVVDQACKDAESRNDFSQAYAFHMSDGFRQTLADQLVGTGLSPDHIANRAQFAGSCMGCHMEASSANLGRGVIAPVSFDFPHIQEFPSTACGQRNLGSTCFPLSIALNTVFLPSRLGTLAGLLGEPIIPDPCENGGGGGGGGVGGAPSFGGKAGFGGAINTTGGVFASGGVGGANFAGSAGKGTPTTPPAPEVPAGPAPVVEIELPQASTPLEELMREDAEIRALSGDKTISGRSAQATH